MKLTLDQINSIKERAADDFLTDLGLMLNPEADKLKQVNCITDMFDKDCAREILNIKSEAYRESFNYYFEASPEEQLQIVQNILHSIDNESIYDLLVERFVDEYPGEVKGIIDNYYMQYGNEGEANG